jgi:hypothetical protein
VGEFPPNAVDNQIDRVICDIVLTLVGIDAFGRDFSLIYAMCHGTVAFPWLVRNSIIGQWMVA